MDIPFLIKYKPMNLTDFEIDNNIKKLLENLISIDKLNIILTGNSGCGKSSLIKVLLKYYFKDEENYEDNILYINSLKEQGIQYYRNDVKCFCQTTSSIYGKKKILILDDIDTINEQSQQVFRNCIDKYSNNVNFITSCTNTQKILESLQSRLLIIKIKPIERYNLEKIMTNIQKKENITITDEAKSFILNICNNSIRLLVNYLEKFKLIDKLITIDYINDICTNISFNKFEELTQEVVINKDINKGIKIIYNIFDEGYSIMDILDNYFLFIKITNLLSEENKYEIIKLIMKFITIVNDIHEHEIELAFFINNLISL